MDLHPDRNPNRDTTAQFQALQIAYGVLSDDTARAKYDADSSIPPAQEQRAAAESKPLEPVVCAGCGAVSVQPRFCAFYTVYAYILGATKRPTQGIFCSKCEVKKAVVASAITLVSGWWSIHGFIWTIESLLRNLFGQRFLLQNAQLQGYQAMYFLNSGRAELARAVAADALVIANRATEKFMRDSADKVKLGYAISDPLRDLKTTLTRLVASVPQGAQPIRLKRSGGVLGNRFAVLAGLYFAFALCLGGWVFIDDRAAAEAERLRLEQQGIAAAHAAAIAASKAAELKQWEQPLPESGVYAIAKRVNYNPKRSPPLKIVNAPGASALLKLILVSSGAEVISVFVRAGDTVEVSVPVGSYRVKLASGQTWYGDAIRFGPDTGYAVLDSTFDFSIAGNQLMGQEITLKRQANGNLRELSLAAGDF
jgi:hypothetical protein